MSESPFVFIDYDRISDVLLWLPDKWQLKFNVKLSRNTNNFGRLPFHSEYGYNTNNGKSISIRREYKYFYTIENKEDRNLDSNIMLRTNDIFVLKMLINNNILPWFVGNTRVFITNKNNKLCIKRDSFEEVRLPVNDGKYIKFIPIICTYEDGRSCEGVRFVINDDNFWFDVPVNTFFEFAYIICNTDMVNAAMSMLSYVKTAPYNINYKDL